MPRKGRARRFREARRLKQGYDDGLFQEGSGTLADVTADGGTEADDQTDDDWDDDWDDEDDTVVDQRSDDWDPLKE